MKGMYFLLLTICLFQFGLNARAEEYEVIPLPPGKTISDVLLERGVQRLYGPQGEVAKTLQLNKLSQESARKLPAHFPVKFLSPVSPVIEVPPTPSEEIVSIEIVPVVEAQKLLLTADAGYLSYVGKSDSQGKFNAGGSYLGIEGEKNLSLKKMNLFFLPSLRFLFIPGLERNALTNIGSKLELRENIRDARIYGGVQFFHLNYIYGHNDSPQVATVNTPGLYLGMVKSWESYSFNMSGKYNLAAGGAAASPGLILRAGNFLREDIMIELTGDYERRRFRSFTQNYLATGLSLTKSF